MSTVHTFSPTTTYGGAGARHNPDQGVPAGNGAVGTARQTTGSVHVTISAAAQSSAVGAVTTDFATVAQDARSVLDAGYEKTGITPSISTNVDEWREIMGGLDRRSLHAIASNEGGQFSQDERDAARTFMNEQQSQIFINASFGGMDALAGTKAVIQFLDNVSAEEKSSLIWAKDRAVNEVNYEIMSGRSGEKDSSLESDNPFVKMIKQALYRLNELRDPSKKVEDMPEYANAEAAHRAGESRFLDKKI